MKRSSRSPGRHDAPRTPQTSRPQQRRPALAVAERPPRPAPRRRGRREAAATAPTIEVAGVLDLNSEGYGFLRSAERCYAPAASDPFVPADLAARFALRCGVRLYGAARPGGEGKGPRLCEVLEIEGREPQAYALVAGFETRTPVNPHVQLRLETGAQPLSMRVVDLLAPLGKGQRALIVAPPRSGKTVLLQQIADAVARNHPEAKLLVLLVDERPEEVTDMQRSVRGEVAASSLDQEVASHVRLAQLVVERGKRLAELGHDVVLLVDSLTRISRAFNKHIASRRDNATMTGGLGVRALEIPKKLFAAARAFEEGGSLTIVATTLVETGSRMDDAIFQEFKGTGNMELVLDRGLAERRIWPAIDVGQSGTRREELLLPADRLGCVTQLRRALASLQPDQAMEQLTCHLGKFRSNEDFLTFLRGSRMFD